MTPYNYTANNPINYLDHNGDYIIIWGADDNGNMYSVMYENGIAYHYTRDASGNNRRGNKYDGRNSFIENTVADLNKISSYSAGRRLIGDLQNSSEIVDIEYFDRKNQHYDPASKKVMYNQANSGFQDGVSFDKSFVKLGHELSHAWDHLVGRSENMHDYNGGILNTEYNAVKFENYLRAMSGETIMRMSYGKDRINFGGSDASYFKNYSFPLRKTEIYKRIGPSTSTLQDNTRIDRNYYRTYDTRSRKFTSGF